jgi:hypothetical protein
MILKSHKGIHKFLALIAVLVFPVISAASEKVCESGKLPKTYRGTYLDVSTVAGTKIELTDSVYRFLDSGGEMQIAACLVQGFRVLTITDASNPDSVENGVLLKSESGNLVLIALNRMPTNDWPNRVSDLIRASAPTMVLQKAR